MYIRVQLCLDVNGTSFLGSDSEGGILRLNSEYVVRSEGTCLVSNFSLCSSLSEISALCLMPLKFCMICWN